MADEITRRLLMAGLGGLAGGGLAGCATSRPIASEPPVQVNLVNRQLPPPPDGTPVGGEADGAVRTAIDVVRRMTVKAMINETGPYDFVVDTGANRTVIALELVEALGLEPSGRMSVHGIAGVLPSARVDIRRLDVGEVVSRRVRMPVLPRRYLGADGLLGVDVLVGRRATLDFANQAFQVRLPAVKAAGSRTRNEAAHSDGEIVVPAKQRFGQLTIVDAELGGIKLTAFLDSGAEITVGNTALKTLVFGQPGLLGGPPVQVDLVSATGQLVSGDLAKVPPLRLGGVRMGNLTCVFADLHTFDIWQLTDRPAMLIGVDVMRHFDAIELNFDASQVTFRSRQFNRGLQGG